MNAIFRLYKAEKTTVKYGKVYTAKVTLPIVNEPERIIRVYLPKEYDGKKRFPVMYMTDGQNMVDLYTSAYGDWKLDQKMHALVKQGLAPFILVGVDCPKVPSSRSNEYTFNNANLIKRAMNKKYNNDGGRYGNEFASFIVHELKPLIDSRFKTLPDRTNTAFGGSSMGGLFAFDISTHYHDVFGFALSFSPAFSLFQKSSMANEVHRRRIKPNSLKIFFYTGGLDPLERHILVGTYEMFERLQSIGFDNDHLQLLIDSRQKHHEDAWAMYFIEAIKMWQNGVE